MPIPAYLIAVCDWIAQASDGADCEVVDVRLITPSGVERHKPDEIESLLVGAGLLWNDVAHWDAATEEGGRLTTGGLTRVEIRRSRTFDSSATPKVGEVRRQPARMAEVDLTALGEQIAATAEKAKADDPKTLRAEIAQLKKELSSHQCPQVEPLDPNRWKQLILV